MYSVRHSFLAYINLGENAIGSLDIAAGQAVKGPVSIEPACPGASWLCTLHVHNWGIVGGMDRAVLEQLDYRVCDGIWVDAGICRVHLDNRDSDDWAKPIVGSSTARVLISVDIDPNCGGLKSRELRLQVRH